MLKPCVYNPQTGEFLEDGSAYPFFIITYLARNPQPIWLPFTKGNEMVIGDKSTSAKRKADELPRLIRNAFKEDDLNPETDYLNVLVATGKGWEIWRVQAKYVINPNITVLVPLATVDPNTPFPTLNSIIYNELYYFEPRRPLTLDPPDLYLSIQGNLSAVDTFLYHRRHWSHTTEAYVSIGKGAYDQHGYLEEKVFGGYFYPDEEETITTAAVIKIGDKAIALAPRDHREYLSCQVILTVDGFFLHPYTVNGEILSPEIRVPFLQVTFSYQPIRVRVGYYSAQVIGWGDPISASIDTLTGIWNLPSDFSQHQVSDKYLLSQVGQVVDTFVHPKFEPSLTIKGLNSPKILKGLVTSWVTPEIPTWTKVAEDIWVFEWISGGAPNTAGKFKFIFKASDNNPCRDRVWDPYNPIRSLLPSDYLVKDPDLYGKTYIPFYHSPFSPTEYPFRCEVEGYQDRINEMVEYGVIEEPDTTYEYGTKPIFVSRYKTLSPTPPQRLTLTLPIVESIISFPYWRIIGYRTYTPQLLLSSFVLPNGKQMLLCMSDIPFVYPEGRLLKLRDSSKGVTQVGKICQVEDKGTSREISRAVMWQPVWLSHSLTSDPTYGDTLVQVGFKVVRWGSPARTEFAFGGLIAGSIWFMDVLRRLRNKQLRDADKVLLRDCICSVDGLFGLIRLTFHYDASSGLIYMREWRLGVPYGNIVPLITFSLRPYHEVRVLRDISAWSVFLDIIDTRTNTVEQRLRIVPRVGGWSVAPVSVSEPILFTHRKSIVNPLISVNPSSSYSIDRSLNLHHTVGRSAHALVTPHLSNINPLIYKGESYPLRFYPLQAPVARLSSLPSQYYRAAQKVYGANIPAYGVMFGNLNAQPIFVVTIPVIEELRSKKVEWFEEFWGKWSVGVAMFLAAPDWAQKLVQGVASLGTLIDWAVLELWEPEP